MHDFLVDVRGAERVFLALCDLYPDADLFTAVYDERGTEGRFAHRTVHTSFLQSLRPSSRTFRALLPLYPSAMESLDLRGYDLVLSSSSAWAHGVLPTETRCTSATATTRSAMRGTRARRRCRPRPARPRRARGDLPALARVGLDRGAARRRVRRELRDDPPAGRELLRPRRDPAAPRRRDRRFAPGPVGDAYVVLSELMPHKRIDVAIRAFNALRRPLVVVGNGPDYRRLRRLAGPTVRFTGRVSDAEAAALLSAARALVVTATEEFGIAAVEAQAAGRPVIALADGGVRETVLDGVTGAFYARPDPLLLADTVRRFDALAVDPDACVGQRRALRRRSLPPRDPRGRRADAREPRCGAPTPVGAPPGRPGVATVAPRRPRPPTASFQALLLAAAAALSGFTLLRGYGPHDEGLMLAWAGRVADGQWPYRDFWSNYAPGPDGAARRADEGARPVAGGLARAARRGRCPHGAGRLPPRAARRGGALGARRVDRGGRRDGVPDRAGPDAAGAAARAVGAARRPRGAGGGGMLAGLAFVFRPEVGVAALAGAVLEARSAKPLLPFAVVAAVLLAPFAIVAGGDMAGQILGFAGDQGLQRLPLVPNRHVGADPNKLLELLFPLFLVLAAAVWAAWALWRRPPRALGARAAARRRPRLSARPRRRVPPAAALGRAGGGPRARGGGRARDRGAGGPRGRARGDRRHGLERRAGRGAHPPRARRRSRRRSRTG